MWTMTPRGFFSVVQHRDEPDDVLIRARSRADLEALCELPLLERHRKHIEESPKADYPYRLRVRKSMWSYAVLEMADEIDYDNFKDAVKKRQGPERSWIYMGVWSRLHGIEREGREAEEYQLDFEDWRDPHNTDEWQACTCLVGANLRGPEHSVWCPLYEDGDGVPA